MEPQDYQVNQNPTSSETEPIASETIVDPSSADFEEPSKDKFSPVLLAVFSLLLICLIAAGVILFSKVKADRKSAQLNSVNLNQTNYQPTPTTSNKESDESTSALESSNTSDEISDIEKDLNDTKLDNLDQELTNIEAEIATP